MTAPEHPSWCDLSLCDAVIGDEVQDYSGAHRSAPTKRIGGFGGYGGLSLSLMQVVDAKPSPVVLVGAAEGRRWHRALADVAPGLLELLAKAGYATPHQPDTPSPDTWAQELGYPSADALFEAAREASTRDGA